MRSSALGTTTTANARKNGWPAANPKDVEYIMMLAKSYVSVALV